MKVFFLLQQPIKVKKKYWSCSYVASSYWNFNLGSKDKLEKLSKLITTSMTQIGKDLKGTLRIDGQT
jgi:hypothetical protein